MKPKGNPARECGEEVIFILPFLKGVSCKDEGFKSSDSLCEPPPLGKEEF